MNDEKNLHESMRVRFSPSDKARFDALWRDKKISQQEAVTQILNWFWAQDPLLQSMILGQIPTNDRQINELLKKRIDDWDPPSLCVMSAVGIVSGEGRVVKGVAARKIPKDPPGRVVKDPHGK